MTVSTLFYNRLVLMRVNLPGNHGNIYSHTLDALFLPPKFHFVAERLNLKILTLIYLINCILVPPFRDGGTHDRSVNQVSLATNSG